MKTEDVEVETSYLTADDDEIEIVCDVELAENDEHDILNAIDADGNDHLKQLNDAARERIIREALMQIGAI